ncbi:MAG: DUF177 domain-containing protein [Nonlabens sp.]
MKLNTFDISFSGLKIGKHEFQFKLEDSFFENFGFEEFNSVNLDVTAVLDKRSTIMDLKLETEGTVNVNCDVTNEPFDLELETVMDIVIKFGEEFNDENDEMLVLPHGEHQFNIAQFIYEMIVLSLPAKKVHPGIEDGTLDSVILDKLNELSVSKPESTRNTETDPRWDVLKKLKD